METSSRGLEFALTSKLGDVDLLGEMVGGGGYGALEPHCVTLELFGVRCLVLGLGAAAAVVLSVDGQEVARTTVARTVPAAFTASESFDIGTDLGSPVSRDCFDRRPFAIDGRIEQVAVSLKRRSSLIIPRDEGDLRAYVWLDLRFDPARLPGSLARCGAERGSTRDPAVRR